jgi:hypothetical protein
LEIYYQHTMKAFSNLKRDFRTRYKPRGRDMRRGNAQALDEDDSESLRPDTAMTQDSVMSTREDIMSDAHFANLAYRSQQVIGESIQPTERPDGRIDSSAKGRETQDEGEVIEYTEPFVFEKLPDRETAVDMPSALEEPQNQAATEDTDSNTPEEPQDQAPTQDTEPSAPEESEAQEAMPEDTDLDLQNQEEEATEDLSPLTFEEAQAIRDQSYLAFASEEEDDFTDGPARFVLGVDGIKQCAALVLTYELSQKIQKAIHGQREYVRVENASLSQIQALSRLEGDVRRQVASCNTRLAIMEEENRLDSEDAQNLEQQRAKLELMVEDVQGRRKAVLTDVEVQGRKLRSLQAAANKHLEEAFICANLLVQEEEEAEPEIEDLDMAQEYEAFCRRLESANDEPFEAAAPPLDLTSEHLQVALPSEEEQTRQNHINALWASKETLEQARRDFEEREIQRAHELNANMVAADNGEAPTDDSPEAFDVRWVLRYRELTKALIEAETAYAETKRTAFEAGVPLPFVDNETVCEAMDGDDDGLGYTISKEQELVASAPSPIVRRWLAKVPEGVEVGSPSFGSEIRSDGDDWEAEEVEISDSRSMLAEGRERARIDRWRKACGDAKGE